MLSIVSFFVNKYSTFFAGSSDETAKMLALINRILDWFKSLFWKEEMELTLVGLQYSGKTTFVNVIAVSEYCLCNNNCSLIVSIYHYLLQLGLIFIRIISFYCLVLFFGFHFDANTFCSSIDHNNILFQSGQFNEDMIPTVGFNMRKITKGNVTIKVSFVLEFDPYLTEIHYSCLTIEVYKSDMFTSQEIVIIIEK